MVSQEQVADTIQTYIAGKMSRREFVVRLTVLGFSLSAVGALVAACNAASTAAPSAAGSSAATSIPSGASTGPATGPWASDPTSVSGTVRLYKGPFLASEPDWQAKYAARFNQTYPNVKVQISQFDWPSATAQLTAALTGGAQDMLYIPEDFYPTFEAVGGPLEDLAPWMEDPGFKKIYANVPPAYITRSKTPGGVQGGVFWVDGPQSMAYINLSLFEKAGVDPTAFLQSYDTMTEAARKIRALGSDIWGIGIEENGPVNFGSHVWYGYMQRAGADILTPDWKEPAFNTPEMAATLQMIQDWHIKDKVCPPFGTYSWAQLRPLFIAGKIGIYHDEPQFVGVIIASKPAMADKWDSSKFPPGQKADTLYSNGGMWCMSASSPNKQATWEAIKSWTVPFKDYFEATGASPIVTDWKELGIWAGEPPQQKIQEMSKYLQGGILHPKTPQMKAVLDPLFDQCYAGILTPQQALDQGVTAVKGVLSS